MSGVKRCYMRKTMPYDMRCFRCGRNSHFANNCFAKTHYTGYPLKGRYSKLRNYLASSLMVKRSSEDGSESRLS